MVIRVANRDWCHIGTGTLGCVHPLALRRVEEGSLAGVRLRVRRQIKDLVHVINAANTANVLTHPPGH